MDPVLDNLWHDPRSRDDRAEFFECEHCGNPVRWVGNLGSDRGSSLQIVARRVTAGTWFDPERHSGLVAVFADRTGYTVGRTALREELEEAVLYPCHWDVCEPARRTRDQMSRQARRAGAFDELDIARGDDDVVLRYEQWRRDRS